MAAGRINAKDVLDVAIIGAGISGVYCGWRLLTGASDGPPAAPDARGRGTRAARSRTAGQAGTPRVAIFEASPRIGGRLLSVTPPGMPHVPCELGGMRFESIHTLVRSLVENVFKLPVTQLDVTEQGNIAYLRGRHLRQSQLNDPTALPYHLKWGEQGRTPGQLLTEYALNQIIPGATTMTPAKLAEAARTAHFDGRPLWQQGLWNVMARVLSAEAYEFGINGMGYDSLVSNWNAADGVPFMLADFASTVTYWKLKDGYEQLPLQLARQFTQRGGALHLSTPLRAFDSARLSDGTRGVILHFDGVRKPVYARKLVLAIPPRSFELLEPVGPLLDPSNSTFPVLLDAVNRIPLFKLFLCYHTPWWEISGVTTGRSVTDLPIRQTYYWGVEGRQPGADPTNTNSVLLASYNDNRWVDFWAGLRHSNEPVYEGRPNPHAPASKGSADWRHYRAPRALVLEAHRQLMELHGVTDAPLPYEAVYRDWMEDPYGAGVHFWSVHQRSAEVIPKVLHPVEGQPIYVTNEAWSHQQGWAEGSLQTTEQLLQKHFQLAAPGWITTPST